MTTKWVTSIEAAELIGLAPYTLRQWRHEQREGQPRFIKLPSGRVRYRRSDLEAFLKQHERSY